MGGVHVIVGEDDLLVSEAARGIFGSDETGLEVVDSLNSGKAELQLADLREVDSSFSTPPFLVPRKTTWWKNVGFLPQSGKGGPSEDVKAALEKFAAKLVRSPLPDNQTFVLTGTRLLATSVFAKTLKKGGADLQVFAAGKPWAEAKAARQRAIDSAAREGLRFDGGAADAFVARVGNDTRSIYSEVAKLRAYLGDGVTTIRAEDVAAITSQGVGVEPVMWEVTDALGARNLEAVLGALKKFESEKGFGLMMTTVIEKFFRQLIEFKDAAARGKGELAAEGLTPFAAEKLRRFLPNWTLRELRIARFRFLNLRERCVTLSSGTGDLDSSDQLVFTEVVRVCRR